ncbi:MAG: SurA N-terminal domain-containing protein [Bdellovibrionales bacterium]|nr:SurA N-terminal domain-containing protein [Bdellovibrionales bacterium]
MLEKIRRPGQANKTGQFKKIISYFIFMLICLVFVFFTPMTSQLIGYGQGVVATVGRQSVYSRELDLLERNLRERYKDRFNTASASEAQKLERQIRQTALAQLLNGYLVSAGAEKEGFFVSDGELRELIRSIPVFQEKGRFIYSRYMAYLKSQYLKPVGFETQIRRDIIRENWRGIFFKAAQSNQLEQDKNKKRSLYRVTARLAETELKTDLLSQLEPLMKTQNIREVSEILKKSKVEWKTVKAFSPGRIGLPQFQNNKKVQQIIFDYLPQTGLIPQVITSRGKIYVVEVTSFEKKSSDFSGVNDKNVLLSFDKPMQLFENWLKFQEKTIEVNINEKLFNFPVGNL